MTPGVFNISDRLSDVLTIDYLLFTSKTFETEQNNRYNMSSTREPRVAAQDKPSVMRDIQSDQPFRPFSFEQFDLVSGETTEISGLTQRRNEKMEIIRKQQRDRLKNKPINRIRKRYLKCPPDLLIDFWLDISFKF